MANAQMLLDPFEKQFDLPALLIERGDGQRGSMKLFVRKASLLPVSGSQKMHATQMFRIVAARVESIERDALIGARPVDLSTGRE